MMKLIESVTELANVKGNDWEQISRSSQNYIEVLCNSNSQEIKEMIKFVYENYYMECPFWAKLIAFKILILENPEDDELRQWAVADSKMFGSPEWSEIVSNW